MEELLRKMEERRTALIKKSDESNDLAELKSINQQLKTLNEDIAALRSAQKPDDEVDERTKAVNAYLAEQTRRNTFPARALFPQRNAAILILIPNSKSESKPEKI